MSARLHLDIVNEASEAKLMVDRELGRMLALMPKAKGKLKQGADFPRSPDATAEAPTYTDLGIKKQQASRWQQAGGGVKDGRIVEAEGLKA